MDICIFVYFVYSVNIKSGFWFNRYVLACGVAFGLQVGQPFLALEFDSLAGKWGFRFLHLVHEASRTEFSVLIFYLFVQLIDVYVVDPQPIQKLSHPVAFDSVLLQHQFHCSNLSI